MKNQEQEITIDFGFRDISILLRERTLDEIRKYDIARDVWVKSEKEELHNSVREKIYYFTSIEYDIHGRIFPLDEIISPRRKCDIIIQNFGSRKDPMSLDAQIYHDFYKGEKLAVKISLKKPGFDPSFKVFNHIGGFVKDPRNGLYEKIFEGSKVLVEVFDLVQDRKRRFIIKTWPLKILEDEKY